MLWPIGEGMIEIVQGNIAAQRTDAIVNPANRYLAHGGGAAAAIVRAGGFSIQEESAALVRAQGPVPTGGAVLTGAGKLPCRSVIHAVGPRMGEGDEDRKLGQAVWNALKLADAQGFTSLAMPAISSGIFGFPKERCADILLATATRFLCLRPRQLRRIVMCNHDAETTEIFQQAARARGAGQGENGKGDGTDE